MRNFKGMWYEIANLLMVLKSECAKTHGKIYTKVRPPLVRHLYIFIVNVYWATCRMSSDRKKDTTKTSGNGTYQRSRRNQEQVRFNTCIASGSGVLCMIPIDDYAKDGRPREVWLLCSFTMSHCALGFKTLVNKFAILNHTALILSVHALRSYLKLICEYELHSLPNKKVSGAKDHGKNYRPLLVRHLKHNWLF